MAQFTLKVRRFQPESGKGPYWQQFDVELDPTLSVLDGLLQAKDREDGSLAVRCSCRAAICGSCGVKINGQSMGVRLAPPFVFDLSEGVKPGENEVEVEVFNTLANFMSAGPSKYVYKGQTVSGLLGPASLRVLPRVRIPCRPVGAAQQTPDGVTK